MFLTARLFGIVTYIFVMLVFLLLTKYTKLSQIKYVFIFYLLSLCTIAFFYVPYITTDVFRHNINAKFLAEQSWYEFWNIVKNSTSGIFTLFYFRYFSTCLSTITCLIVYGIIFYIIYNSSKKLKVSNIVISLVLLWIMTNDFYLISISNIRSYISVVFVVLCIYREIFQKKFGTLNILLYLCAIEMHLIGIVLVVFRFISYLLTKIQFTFWKSILFPVIIIIVISTNSFYIPLLNSSFDKFEIYYTEIDYSYIWERIIFTIQTIVQLYILFRAYKYKIFNNEYFRYYKSVVTLAVIALVLCHLHVTFMQRWIIFSAILEIPILLEILKIEYSLHRNNMKKFIITTSIITFTFVCSRGNLCSLKFWE